MFVPIILGSDKTTVSVATGNTEYYPLYISNGNIHNSMHQGHPDGVSLLGFLSIPKGIINISFDSRHFNALYYIIAEQNYANDPEFRKFRHHLFHTTLEAILENFKPVMEEPEVVKCPDGHLHRAVYGLGPYIADYPEQCLVLFKGGAQSECQITSTMCIVISILFTRCLAHKLNLDSDDPQLVCHCHELSRAFIQSLTIK